VIHQLLPVTAATYRTHPIHSMDRIWTETNCYVDVWVEVLHALGLESLAAGAFALSTDFEGDQWTFSKYPPEDLRLVYGIDVHEMNPWRPVIDHVVEQLELGRLLTVEVNSYFLPDTHGVAYRIDQVKSTIIPNMVDRARRRLGYFHNAGYFELDGDDFDGVFRLGDHTDDQTLPPYVELVRLERTRCDPEVALVATAERLLGEHLTRRPVDNPVTRMGERIRADQDWLRTMSLEDFHLWAFGTLRQCGASAELAAAFCMWLGTRIDSGQHLIDAAVHWTSLAESTKSLQFQLARVARGRPVDFTDTLETMAEHWQDAQDLSARRVMAG